MIGAASTAARPRPTPHRLGRIFEILDEMGEDPTFTFALQRVGAAQPLRTVEIHHGESDGHGGLSRFLRDQGIGFTSPTLRGDTVAPSFADRLRAVVRVARAKGEAPLVLRVRNPAWTRGAKVAARAAAGTLLSVGQSDQVFAAARAAGVSVTSYLLHALTEAVVPLIVAPGPSITWGIPVNMRGPVRVVPEDANASSIMPVHVPRGGTATAVQGALRASLAANLHWGKWDQLNTAARLGKRVLRKKVSHYYRTADPARMGVFSNVGAWRGETSDDLGIVVYGLPTLTDPLFAAALTWNGKLALTLRVHPSLTTDAATVATWHDAWLARLEVRS